VKTFSNTLKFLIFYIASISCSVAINIVLTCITFQGRRWRFFSAAIIRQYTFYTP